MSSATRRGFPLLSVWVQRGERVVDAAAAALSKAYSPLVVLPATNHQAAPTTHKAPAADATAVAATGQIAQSDDAPLAAALGLGFSLAAHHHPAALGSDSAEHHHSKHRQNKDQDPLHAQLTKLHAFCLPLAEIDHQPRHAEQSSAALSSSDGNEKAAKAAMASRSTQTRINPISRVKLLLQQLKLPTSPETAAVAGELPTIGMSERVGKDTFVMLCAPRSMFRIFASKDRSRASYHLASLFPAGQGLSFATWLKEAYRATSFTLTQPALSDSDAAPIEYGAEPRQPPTFGPFCMYWKDKELPASRLLLGTSTSFMAQVLRQSKPTAGTAAYSDLTDALALSTSFWKSAQVSVAPSSRPAIYHVDIPNALGRPLGSVSLEPPPPPPPLPQSHQQNPQPQNQQSDSLNPPPAASGSGTAAPPPPSAFASSYFERSVSGWVLSAQRASDRTRLLNDLSTRKLTTHFSTAVQSSSALSMLLRTQLPARVAQFYERTEASITIPSVFLEALSPICSHMARIELQVRAIQLEWVELRFSSSVVAPRTNQMLPSPGLNPQVRTSIFLTSDELFGTTSNPVWKVFVSTPTTSSLLARSHLCALGIPAVGDNDLEQWMHLTYSSHNAQARNALTRSASGISLPSFRIEDPGYFQCVGYTVGSELLLPQDPSITAKPPLEFATRDVL
ncbi:hypothetical protein CAOG_06391 [Capsaspora owczarzaki ATCC 30864]|uniref:Uncharacterized protein n=1 Tax=Capsaspora owczarzaki (strain ATCC 30864) TaxID=595528 RepID=A0A0D2VWQ8_CAPO3|nr:hypothetical protein CAOG_06391 [Capsaspora owczarzaki ATCC 30864]KJE96017.1 hypothetical protein CAOG_006391 [Capsaspora owczarzaki ATCC 30864]|eukprot:XP_004345140.2 hypothetical protein CAOG_06391 [Capsaspora owczarzaki ATCC 30864]